MDYLIFDLEIEKYIHSSKQPDIPGIEYCEGWEDHGNMGISTLCTYSSISKRYHYGILVCPKTNKNIPLPITV